MAKSDVSVCVRGRTRLSEAHPSTLSRILAKPDADG
jgi:hypothetical protein